MEDLYFKKGIPATTEASSYHRPPFSKTRSGPREKDGVVLAMLNAFVWIFLKTALSLQQYVEKWEEKRNASFWARALL